MDVIEFVPDAEKVLKNLSRYLSSRGHLIINGLRIDGGPRFHPMGTTVNFDEIFFNL